MTIIAEVNTRENETEDVYFPPAVSERLLLENGDFLTQEEFERRYEAMPHVKKAELIEGIVSMGSPVSAAHSGSHGQTMGWLAIYSFATPGVTIHDNPSLRLDAYNEFQPDALLNIESRGRCRVSQDGYLEGPPELVAEIAVSSASQDMGGKMSLYARHGVQEYVVWQVRKHRLDWFCLNRKGKYEPLNPDAAGVVRSRAFPGLHLSVDALLREDLAEVSATLQKGLQTEEHAEFVRQI